MTIEKRLAAINPKYLPDSNPDKISHFTDSWQLTLAVHPIFLFFKNVNFDELASSLLFASGYKFVIMFSGRVFQIEVKENKCVISHTQQQFEHSSIVTQT